MKLSRGLLQSFTRALHIMSPRSSLPSALPSSNWLALQKKLKPDAESSSHGPRKKRKISHESTRGVSTAAVAAKTPEVETDFPRGVEGPIASTSAVKVEELVIKHGMKNGESIDALRKMILGESTEIRPKKAATKYVAIDCEMVGVGFEGQESSLARVSVVNFDGTVLLDEIVQQKERVVDYRTQYSGIRPTDMVNAKLFADVQNRVAKLLEGKVLVGHAVWNDLKALLLSHPRYLIRDTQVLAAKHKVVKSPRPALRHLVAHEFGMAFHTGEHSSITDARATMAIFRLHRKVWETGLPRIYQQAASLKKLLNVAPAETSELLSDDEDAKTSTTDAKAPTSKKRKAEDASAETAKVILQAKKRAATFPGGGRKGVSSGLSTVVKHKDKGASWWKELK